MAESEFISAQFLNLLKVVLAHDGSLCIDIIAINQFMYIKLYIAPVAYQECLIVEWTVDSITADTIRSSPMIERHEINKFCAAPFIE